jgi:hypothetical protein
MDRRRLLAMAPLPLTRHGSWRTLVKGVVTRQPNFAPPEDILSGAMAAKGMSRIDFLGAVPGLWTLHPRTRPPAFYNGLEHLVRRVETDDVPDAQRGHYDLLDSFVESLSPS